jgi:hypothetical protein
MLRFGNKNIKLLNKFIFNDNSAACYEILVFKIYFRRTSFNKTNLNIIFICQINFIDRYFRTLFNDSIYILYS